MRAKGEFIIGLVFSIIAAQATGKMWGGTVELRCPTLATKPETRTLSLEGLGNQLLMSSLFSIAHYKFQSAIDNSFFNQMYYLMAF